MALLVDILAFRGTLADQTLQQDFLDDTGEGETCVGVQKLAQRWVIEFCTEDASIPYREGRGCAFVRQARQGKLQTELDVFQAFALSSARVRRNLVNEESANDSPAERFAGATLEQLVISPGLLRLQVNVRSRAGTGRRVVLPILLTT